MNNDEQDALAAEILQRLDPKGELGSMLRSMAGVQASTFARFTFGALFGELGQRLVDATRDAQSFVDDAAAATLLFYPLGWAPSGSVPVNVYRRALDEYRASGDPQAAEQIMVRGWNDGGRFATLLKRALTLGAGDEYLTTIARDRYRLIQIGLRHHDARDFAASIPIILAQAEGIVFDVTGLGLFSRLGDREHLADDTTLAGMAVGITALQKIIGSNANTSAKTGALTRHGIMHGRELGYDTEANSTKALVFLVAIVELAQPRARALSDARRQAEFEKWADSDEVDEIGARRDRRGFDRAARALHAVATRMGSDYRHDGRYPTRELVELFPGSLGDDLVDHRRTTLVVEAAGRSYYAYHQTPPGFYLGLAGNGEVGIDYYFAGASIPTGGIGQDNWRSVRDGIPPDWQV